jgi:hypothetical protein
MPVYPDNSNVLLLACEPLPLVRIAFVGLGKRGKESLSNYMYLEGVEIKVISDLNMDNLAEAQHILKKYKKKQAEEYNGKDDWQKICRRDDIDLVYVCASRNIHAEIAVCAMQNGKHVAVEVPVANNLKECWDVVGAAEKYRRHCIMLENCCYDRFEMTALNMKQQGVLGDIIHAEGGYIHDLRQIDFTARPDYAELWLMEGNPYPTHGLGPLCQVLDIHRGDRLSWLVSVSNAQFGFPCAGGGEFYKRCVLGNTNTTIIKTEKEKTIVLQHDISSPRPYSRNYLLSGTSGFLHKGEMPVITLSAEADGCNKSASELLEKYEHPFYREKGELAQRVGGHGGMDFIMDYRLIYCLRKGLPLDMDVYDAAEWSCIIELTETSVKNNSTPVQIPDFTRGAWNRLDGLKFAE